MLTSKPLTVPDAVSINYCDIGNEGLGAELGWRRLNVTELAHPYPNSELASRYGCSHIPTNISPNGFTVMENARYSLPLGLTSLNRLWESCTVMVFAQDPPRALSRVSALVDPTTTAAALPSAAKPGASGDPQLTPTLTPQAAPTASIKPTASGLDALDPLELTPFKPDSGHAGQQSDSTIPDPKLNNQPTSHTPTPTTGLVSQDPIQPNVDTQSTAHPSLDSNQDSTTQGSHSDPKPSIQPSPNPSQGQHDQGPGNPNPSTSPNPDGGQHSQDTDPSSNPKQSTTTSPIAGNGQSNQHPQDPALGPEASTHPSSDPNTGNGNQGLDQPKPSPDPNEPPLKPSPGGSSMPNQGNEGHTNLQPTQPQSSNINPLSTAAVVIGGQTFSSGSIPVTVAGNTHSIAAPIGDIVVDSKTISQYPHSAPPQVLSFGSQTISYSINTASEIIVNSQTLHPGSPVVVASHTIALDTSADHSNILINGQPTLLPSTEDSSQNNQHSPDLQPVNVGGQTMTTNDAGNYMFGSQTLKNGAPAITVSGTPVSLAPASEITIGRSTIPLSPPRVTAAPQLTVGGHPISTDNAGDYVVGFSTLRPGSPAITISNTPISIDASSSRLIVGSSTIQLFPPITPNAALHVGDIALPYSINSASNLVIAGSQTLTPGGPAITISNTPISLGPSATQLVVGSSTVTLPHDAPSQAPLSLGSTTLPYSINSASNLVVGSQPSPPVGKPYRLQNANLS